MARRKNLPEGETADSPDFEVALGELEAIVDAMEHEHLALEDLVAHYEKGSALLNRCESILQSARERIELITLRSQSEISLDADPKPTDISQPLVDSDDDDDNDIRLF